MGLVAVTKIDMVDPELLELAVEDISEFLKGTFLEGRAALPGVVPDRRRRGQTP